MSLLRLTRLEDLDLGGSLSLVRDPLPDLGRLPALRVLGLSGWRTGHAPVREPAHIFLRELPATAPSPHATSTLWWWVSRSW
ncbi:hypothetical protein AB0K48_35775 [Nonomuraea sp. NPDC055795]